MKYSDQYFVFDKDLGRPQLPGEDAYAKTNSVGRTVIELTDEQRYAFDLRGWLLIPGVLSADEIAAAKEHIVRLHTDRDALPEFQRSSMSGPCEDRICWPRCRRCGRRCSARSTSGATSFARMHKF